MPKDESSQVYCQKSHHALLEELATEVAAALAEAIVENVKSRFAASKEERTNDKTSND